MAEFKIPQATVWAEFELDSALVSEPVKFEVKPLLKRSSAVALLKQRAQKKDDLTDEEAEKYFAIIEDLISDRIVGWDLTSEGVPIPCDEENKAAYLPILFWEMAKKPLEEGQEERQATVFFWLLFDFVSNPANFVKN